MDGWSTSISLQTMLCGCLTSAHNGWRDGWDGWGGWLLVGGGDGVPDGSRGSLMNFTITLAPAIKDFLRPDGTIRYRRDLILTRSRSSCEARIAEQKYHDDLMILAATCEHGPVDADRLLPYRCMIQDKCWNSQSRGRFSVTVHTFVCLWHMKTFIMVPGVPLWWANIGF